MATQTISIKFADRATQDSHLRRLQRVCGKLSEDGVARRCNVQAIFPGHQDPRRAALFTVKIDGAQSDLTERFVELPGVEFVQATPPRRALTNAS